MKEDRKREYLLTADFSARFDIKILKGNLLYQFNRSKRNSDIS